MSEGAWRRVHRALLGDLIGSRAHRTVSQNARRQRAKRVAPKRRITGQSCANRGAYGLLLPLRLPDLVTGAELATSAWAVSDAARKSVQLASVATSEHHEPWTVASLRWTSTGANDG
jgi:hypothetical protein